MSADLILSGSLRRRTPERRAALAATRPYALTLLPVTTVLQPIFRDHNQAQKGSCVGQCYTDGIEPHVSAALSAVDLWTDARRRQGDLANPLTGIYSEHAIESVVNRGVSRYVPGEDERDWGQDQQIATLEQELDADARRIDVTAIHRTIVANRTPQLCDALQRDYACGFGAGVLDPYMSIGLGAVAGPECWGGDAGHEQRIVGYVAAGDMRFPIAWRGCFIVHNSWIDWGGLILPCAVTLTNGQALVGGSRLSQCVLVPASVIETQIWDADALEVKLIGG
jgi:hypothetical protein